MSRLIDADMLTEVLKSNGLKDSLVYMFINQEPTVDAEPVVHAHWEKVYDRNYKCSVCGAWYEADEEEILDFDYCPHCGAKMDLKDGE